jgi:hypothetical protein
VCDAPAGCGILPDAARRAEVAVPARNLLACLMLLVVPPVAAVRATGSAEAQPLAAAQPPAAALRVAPRAVVTRAATAIEREYFDVTRAKTVAADLRAAAAAGRFDAMTDPRDLASALTTRLQPIDRHFVVTWATPVVAPAAPPASAASGPAVDPARARPVARPPTPRSRSPLLDADAQLRRNFGFRRVDVLPGNVGLVQLDSFAPFSADAPAPSAREVADVALAFVARTGALIVDLRENGGGSPAMVGYLAGHFVPEDADVFNVFEQRDAPDQSERSPVPIADARRRTDVPLYVLVSARTGSAAESFAYTLQAAKRATIVGEPTGGAANPGRFVDLGDGLRLFVSFGRPVNPVTRSNWEGTGVRPDVQVPAADALLAAHELALNEQFRRLTAADSAPAADPPAVDELRWTLDAVRAQRQPARAANAAEFAGAYGPRRVRADGSRLVLEHGRRPPKTLLPLGGDTYTLAEDPYVRFEFERDAGGRVAALVTRTVGGLVTRDARAAPAERESAATVH